ncbi:magnesium transporter CorA family protein [Brassicibacter mesophilus]|uniref:magnesium transporter CorA family protein n=1 Tax=Brassicibacter mesophilus TaxID=745119 RepID=UPI003D24B2FF
MEIYKILSGSIKECSFEEVLENTQNKYWMIVTPQEMQDINKFFHFSPQTIHECLDSRQMPRLDVYDAVSFGVLNIISNENSTFSLEELNFYLTKNHLIFVIKGKSNFVSMVKKAVFLAIKGTTNNTHSLEKILYILIDQLTSSDNKILNSIEMEISEIEENLIKGEKKDYIKEIIDLRKKLLFLKRYYEPLLDIAEGLEENENGLLDEKMTRYFKILTNRIERLNRNVLNLRDYVTQVREAYQAQVDINLNNIMKLFTVITTIFLPLGLIAGWYGMNFKNMPELSWVYGYPFAFFLSGLVILISIIYFKKKGLL